MKKVYSIPLILLLSFFYASLGLWAQNAGSTGSWGEVIPTEVVGTAAANLPDGRVLLWASKFPQRFNDWGDGKTYTQIFDPSTGGENGTLSSILLSQTEHDMFCPGINNLADGTIMVSGGASNTKTSFFNFATNTWTKGDEMVVPRGYHAGVTLANGDVFIIGGSWSGGRLENKIGELWGAERGWKALPGIPATMLYNSNDQSTEGGGIFRIDNHAHLWTAPNGKVFHAGPGETMHWIEVSGEGSFTEVGKRGDATYSMNMNSVMYDVGKLMILGGARAYSGPAGKPNAYIIDINDENNVSVTRIADLNKPRTLANTIALPTGEILVIGGASSAGLFTDAGSIYEPEIYNPSTNTWTLLAPMTIPRRYHATAILMADGRILTAGGGLCNCAANHSDMQIFSPPYLFNSDGSLAARPSISAPESASYNSSLTVTGSDDISAFSFVRMSSVTHSNNNEQRRIPISFTKVGTGTFSLSIPNANVLPPGYYMLFAINSQGVPSMAEAVQLGSSSPLDLSGSTACVTENSGFEYMGNGIGFGAFKQYNAGEFFNDFWTVTDASITVHSNFHRNLGRDDNLGGIFHISLASGTIKQTLINLVPGQSYELSLDYAVHDLATIDPSINIRVGTALDESFDASNRGNVSDWLTSTYTFVANAASMELTLQGSATPANGGILVDNIKVCRTGPLIIPSDECVATDNGFEGNFGIPAGGWSTFNAGQPFIGAWSVTEGSVDIHDNTHRNLGLSDGTGGAYHLDMNGTTPGTIQQSLNGLHVGEDYLLSFDYAVHELTNAAVLEIQVGSSLNEVLQASNIGSSDGWLSATYRFTANAETAALTLKGSGGLPYAGVLLDNVEVCKAESENLGCSGPQNLALNKASTQSSTYGNGVASYANDGITTGSSPWSADLQHTQSETQPWWEVDLGQLSDIETVTLYNRSDGIQDRLKDFYILVSPSAFDPTADLSDHLGNNAISQQFFSGAAGAQETLSFSSAGRYVRIQLTGTGILHMAEVEVMGCVAENDPCNGAEPLVINPAGPFLENAGIQQLTASPSGGTWGGAATESGGFDPSAGSGTYTVSYTYTNSGGCTQTVSSEILVNAVVEGCLIPSNLALNRPSRQSSTYGNGQPRFANDGNTQGSSPWSADLQHTTNELQPWWEVDLGSSSQIGQIQLYNRSDGSQDRLQNFYLLVSETPFDPNASLDDHLANPAIIQSFFSGRAGAKELISLNETGRYVRVQLAGSGILHMAEVEVLGCNGLVQTDPCEGLGTSNLALNQNSTQSSTYGNGVPSLANDGNETANSPWSADLQHTQNEFQPWWQVDLGSQGQLETIRIVNRTGGGFDRLKDFYVLVSNTPFDNVATLTEHLENGNIIQVFFSGNAGQEEILPLNTPGRYVRIQLTGAGILHLAEVQVTGCATSSQATRLASPEAAISVPETGIYGDLEKGVITLLPNPASRSVRMLLENEAKDTPVMYGIFTLAGAHIKTIYGGTDQRINIVTLPPGFYLVKAKTPRGDFEAKLLVQ